jgi:cell fate regulator YaaT (PSP1 superfamily)
MYNINLSFFRSKEMDDNTCKLQNKCDLSYKNAIAQSLIKPDSNCSGCLSNIARNDLEQHNFIELNCSGMIGHSYCALTEQSVSIDKNDFIIISYEDSLEIASVLEIGDIVKIKILHDNQKFEELPVFVRKADEEDLRKFHQNSIEELKAKFIFKEKVNKNNLEMKLVDVHFQFDRKRLFFFYTADGRIDFRVLAKELASVFKTRIELRQIGVRDESKRKGGIGSCGREYCCSSFLNNFKRISTQLATEQNSSVNLSKLSGPCGKLKCCLSFESEDN